MHSKSPRKDHGLASTKQVGPLHRGRPGMTSKEKHELCITIYHPSSSPVTLFSYALDLDPEGPGIQTYKVYIQPSSRFLRPGDLLGSAAIAILGAVRN